MNLSFAPLTLLDTADEWQRFSKVGGYHTTQWESSVVIDGMHCAACAANIESALKKMPGVLKVDINAASHRGRIWWDETKIVPSRWLQSIEAMGYSVVPALDSTQRTARQRETRQALWRWLVAGFCMMQVMMYSTPEYMATAGEMTGDIRQLLRWASWLITLPVLLFSCKPFFASAWLDVRHRQISMDLPVALGIAITFIVSTVGTFVPSGVFGRAVYFDSLTMFVFFLLTGRWLELRLRDRTVGALEALMNRMPESVERKTAAGEFESVLVRHVQIGDILRIRAGEAFPADGRLLEGETMVDEALLTGESKPIHKTANSPVIAGSFNMGASAVMVVDTVGRETRYAQIVSLMEQASSEKPHIVQLADRFAKPFLIGVLCLAAITIAYGWSVGPAHALMTAVAVLIVTCPCALSLAAPAAMLAAAGALAKKGVFVRRLQALEMLAKIDTLIFDKTGTLTRDQLTVSLIYSRRDIGNLLALDLACLLAKHSTHPVARSIVRAANAANASNGGAMEIEDSLVTEVMGMGISSQNYRLGSAAYCGVEALEHELTQVHLSDENGWVASFVLSEQIRCDAQSTLDDLQKMGISVQLLSGDMTAAVQAVATQLHLQNYRGECTPASKLATLKSLQQEGHKVAMVGDGLNDAPVLAGADVSFAFGSAVPLAQAKSDFLVLGGQLKYIALAIKQAKRTLRVVKQNLLWALFYNAVSVPLAVAGYMPAWVAGIGMAGSSLIVVANAMRLIYLEHS